MEQSKCSSGSAEWARQQKGREPTKCPVCLGGVLTSTSGVSFNSLSSLVAALCAQERLKRVSHKKGGKVRADLRWCRKNHSSEIAGLSVRADFLREGHGAIDLLSYLDGLCSPCENALRPSSKLGERSPSGRRSLVGCLSGVVPLNLEFLLNLLVSWGKPRASSPCSCFFTRYLVDPASSHMLVSKIKPCMSKYKPH